MRVSDLHHQCMRPPDSSFRAQRVAAVFIFLCAILFASTSVLKLLAISSATFPHSTADPVVGVFRLRTVALGASIWEAAVAIVLLISTNTSRRLLCIAWTSSAFLGYRVAGHIQGVTFSCPCFGSLPAALGLDDSITRRIGLAILVGMLSASILLHARSRIQY